jgi:putative endopeptidase
VVRRKQPSFLFLLAGLVLSTALLAAQSSSAVPAPSRGLRGASGLELADLDRHASACTDFYQFACGGWMAANPMPADRQRWGRFTELQERNFETLRRILESPAPAGDIDRVKARNYYAACMDEATIEARGLVPLDAELARIARARPADLPALVAHLHSIGVNVFFRFGSDVDRHDATRQVAAVDQGGLGMPDRDYYLKADGPTRTIRQQYLAHVGSMLDGVPVAAGAAARRPEAVLTIETALATAALDRTARRDPAATDHMMSRADWQALTPAFNWSAYLAAAGAPAFDRVNVAVPAYFRSLDTLLRSTPFADLQTYLTWHLVSASAQLLPKKFADENFNFYNRILGGQQAQLPRWQRCVTQTNRELGEALGRAFVEQAFGPAAKNDTLRIVQGIKTAMKRDIAAAAWMGETTKRAADAKLDAVVDRIGYPDKWRDYASVAVARDDALGNRERAIAFERRRDIRKIGQRVDRTEWFMTPPTVNAYYSAEYNNINFPAGILQPPFYGEGRDAAVNYGAIGAVVGHELTHGFDDQGRKYDASGNLHDWWTAADAKAFEARSSCIADQYSQYVVTDDIRLNGRLTLGENTADNGGVRLALMAYLAGPGAGTVVDGFTPEQRFFLGFAQIWCENRRPEFDRLSAKTDPHSPGRYRVNGVVSNMPEFQKAFGCAPDAPMVRQTQCRVW